MDRDEQQPLLGDNKQTRNETKDTRLVQPTWRHYLVAPVGFLFVASYVVSFFTTVQYTVYAVQKEYFPNESIVNLTTNSRCEDNETSQEFQKFVSAEADASKWNAYFAVASGLPALVSCLLLGSYTDRMGRKTLLILCLCGTLSRTIVSTVGIYTEMNLSYFLIGFVIEGCTGYLANMMQSTHAYVADITKSGKNRSIGFAGLILIYGTAMTIATFATGFMIQSRGYSFTITTSLGMLVLSLIVVISLLPETITKEKRSEHHSIFKHLRNVILFYTKSEQKLLYGLTLGAFFCVSLTVTGRMTTETLYFLKAPFCWNPFHIGWFSAARGLIQDVFGLLFVKLSRHCISDAALSLFGCLSSMIYLIMIGLAKTDLTLYIGKFW